MALSIQSKLLLAIVGVIMMSLWQPAASHGRLWTPPARGTMFRRGYSTPPNYNDNQMFCGGLERQKSNGYKCGTCGDPYDVATPRPHEAGGKYATGAIVGTYKRGHDALLQVDLTANHKGWFEFKICPTNDYKKAATQECLDKNVLQLADGSGTKIYVEQFGSSMVNISVKLPADLSCDFCVLQWRYHAGNSWGNSPGGKGCLGCGQQEEFYGCADIKIESSGSPDPQTTTKGPGTSTTTSSTTSTTTSTTSTEAPVTSPTKKTTTATETPEPTEQPGTYPSALMVMSCKAERAKRIFEKWCNTNCNMGYCPPSFCKCQKVPDPRLFANLPSGCYAKTPFADWKGMDKWCMDNCLAGVCQISRCICF